MAEKLEKLTPDVYLKKIHNRMRFSNSIIITPLSWLGKLLASNKIGKEWSANKATVYKEIGFGKNRFDVLVSLPGASMTLITAEEALASGARQIIFVGTGGSINGKHEIGDVIFNPRSISVLSPYSEHDKWDEIKKFEVVDMESKFLSDLARKYKVEFYSVIIISDAIWRNRWLHKNVKLNKPLKSIKEWLGKIDITKA